jgi:hypothetical protein
MTIVRYADDFIVGFQHESDAQRFLNEMREQLREFAVSLHPEQTRLTEFGRFAYSFNFLTIRGRQQPRPQDRESGAASTRSRLVLCDGARPASLFRRARQNRNHGGFILKTQISRVVCKKCASSGAPLSTSS